jgi:hypothetical protein
MIDYRLCKNFCEEHGTEWSVVAFKLPFGVNTIDKIYHRFLDILGEPTIVLSESNAIIPTSGILGQIPKYFNISNNLEDKICNFQTWLATNRLATLKYDTELDTGMAILISQEIAALMDPDWVAEDIARQALDGVDNLNDIQWL